MTAQRKKLYLFVKRIPKAKVSTYGAIAKAVKLPGGARAAGYAMASCPKGLGIPWHRVVGARGRILIREPQASLQRRLLESERVKLAGNRVDIAAHGWFPKNVSRPAKRRRSVSRAGR